ncbi:MAG TPA: hypothetical protein PLV92_27980, partial [Pirellulaceae bacterium]|nr:hypothetical protein [Pirellulaceae bacterium]
RDLSAGSGAGAGSGNTIHKSTLAYAKNSAFTVSVGAMTVKALDQAAILAGAGGIGLAGNFGGTGLGVSAGVSVSINDIANTVKSYVESSTLVVGGLLDVAAQSAGSIQALAIGGALAAAVGGATGAALAIGVTVAKNKNDNDVEAYLRDVRQPTGGRFGAVHVAAVHDAAIESLSVAASLAVGASTGAGIALSGGGAVATNIVLGKTNAFVEASNLVSTGDFTVTTNDRSTIDATVPAVAVSVGVGGNFGVAASIGVSVARNFIGYDPSGGDSLAVSYTTDQDATTLTAGQRVRVAHGAMQGDVYEYLGLTLTDGDAQQAGAQPIDLSSQNFQDSTIWKQVGLTATPGQVEAYSLNSSLTTSGRLTLESRAEQTIDAVV